MSTFTEVDPETLIDRTQFEPEYGRGAWTREGIEFGYRISRGTPTIGTVAERSLAHWAVSCGAWAVQKRLILLKHLAPIADDERGIWGPKSDTALKKFQAASADPESGKALTADGLLGQSDARALWTPLLNAAEREYKIPELLLRGETQWESALDVCAVGYYIFYANTSGGLDYRGVDRGMSQINSLANPQVTWEQAFDPAFAIPWSAQRMRSFYDKFKKSYGATRPDAVLWDAAVMAHNNPSWANQWAKAGAAPNEQAAKYVGSVRAARYGDV